MYRPVEMLLHNMSRMKKAWDGNTMTFSIATNVAKSNILTVKLMRGGMLSGRVLHERGRGGYEIYLVEVGDEVNSSQHILYDTHAREAYFIEGTNQKEHYEIFDYLEFSKIDEARLKVAFEEGIENYEN